MTLCRVMLFSLFGGFLRLAMNSGLGLRVLMKPAAADLCGEAADLRGAGGRSSVVCIVDPFRDRDGLAPP